MKRFELTETSTIDDVIAYQELLLIQNQKLIQALRDLDEDIDTPLWIADKCIEILKEIGKYE